MNKISFTWKDFDEAIQQIANRIPNDFDFIYGVPRGGLVVAVALSHKLHKPLKLDPDERLRFIKSDILVVDDISDSGETLCCLNFEAKYTATLHFVRSSVFEPTVWIHEKPKDSWVVYPWEEREEKCLQL